LEAGESVQFLALVEHDQRRHGAHSELFSLLVVLVQVELEGDEMATGVFDDGRVGEGGSLHGFASCAPTGRKFDQNGLLLLLAEVLSLRERNAGKEFFAMHRAEGEEEEQGVLEHAGGFGFGGANPGGMRKLLVVGAAASVDGAGDLNRADLNKPLRPHHEVAFQLEARPPGTGGAPGGVVKLFRLQGKAEQLLATLRREPLPADPPETVKATGFLYRQLWVWPGWQKAGPGAYVARYGTDPKLQVRFRL
jgi:hypothetical protein